MMNEILRFINDEVQKKIEELSKDIAAGKAKDHGEYKWGCGMIRGLMMATNIIMETVERVDKEDDE